MCPLHRWTYSAGGNAPAGTLLGAPHFPEDPCLDLTNYALGPHTDAVSKVVTLLIYLPQDDSQARYGTSIYAPKDPARRQPCAS